MKQIIGILCLLLLAQSYTVNRPIVFTYINVIPNWWPPEGVAAGLGVPGYA